VTANTPTSEGCPDAAFLKATATARITLRPESQAVSSLPASTCYPRFPIPPSVSHRPAAESSAGTSDLTSSRLLPQPALRRTAEVFGRRVSTS
jgi:hypothetical protein